MGVNTTLPQGIEIFRDGTHVDDAGVSRTFSRGDIDAMASAYQPALHDAPLTIGHPKTDEPRYGGVTGLQAVDNAAGQRILVMSAGDVEPAFAEAVLARRFPKRSAAFYPPAHPQNPKPGAWYLRHVGFLGAQPPAVRGLADLPRLPQFADEGAGLVAFSEPASPSDEDTRMDKELQAKLDAETAARQKAEQGQRDAEAKLAGTIKAQRDAQHAEHVAFAEAQLKAGRITKPEAGELVAVLDQAAAAEVVQFGEGDDKKPLVPVAFVKRLVERAAPLASFSERGADPLPNTGAGQQGRTDAEVDRDARAYATKHNVSYAEALQRTAVSFTS